MLDETIESAKDNFFNKKYFTSSKSQYELTETGNDLKQGKTLLVVNVGTSDNLCWRNYDSDNDSKCNFLNSKFGLQRRVDHFILKKNLNDEWTLHMIEMKTTITNKKFEEIKEKFLGSFWSIKVFAMFLGISFDIKNVFLYTTYHADEMEISNSTNPRGNIPLLGTDVKPNKKIFEKNKKEWDSGYLKIKIFPYSNEEKDEVTFKHTKIKMNFVDDTLNGTLYLT